MKLHKRKYRLLAGALASALLLGSALTVGADGQTVDLPGTIVTADERNYAWVKTDEKTHTYDFTSTDIQTYSKDEKLATFSLRNNMVLDGQTLGCKPGGTYSFGSAIFLGDDYGVRGGTLSFDIAQTGGKLSVGLRLEKQAPDKMTRGIWFSFDGTGNMVVSVPETSLTATIAGVATTGKLTFQDTVDTIEVSTDKTVVARVSYDAYDGMVTVKNADGKVLASVERSPVNAAGYFTLLSEGMVGTVDNLSFTHATLTRTDRVTNATPVDYSNWVAIDDRDRELPTGEEAGAVRENKQVGLFYFVCQTGSASETPRDNTYLYNTLGLDGMKNYLTNSVNADSYFWAEPYFGYYLNTDSWVQRKHAYMLEAAGVDFIFVDLTNGATYDKALISLFDTWKAIRDEGGSTPDICFIAAGSIGAVWNNVKGYIYSEEGVSKYGDLFYRYEGKPLLMANISTIKDAATRAELEERFTIRHCWAWSLTAGQWNWLQEYKIDEKGRPILSNGDWGLSPTGKKEELALCIGHHPTTSKGRSYVNGQLIYGDDFGFGLDSGAGTGFANSFAAVKQLDPDMMLITGWNEWIAGLNIDKVRDFAGTKVNDFSFVDQFNTEYSRDGEPMKLRDGEGVGFGDNYYYQMASYIREFKGWNIAASASGQTTIDLSSPESWANVGPLFTDNANDTAWRSEVGYFAGYTYVNGSGRNDLVTAKVSQDAQYLYFTVNTAEDVVIADDSDWMNLYLNVDGDSKNGWEGFDFVINRARDGHYVSVESLADGWGGRHIGQALYHVVGDTMTVRVDKAVLGIEGAATEVLFKWADNATVDGNVMEFMDLGDTAPNDRYAFRYTCEASAVGGTPTITYTLSGQANTRDESTPLPGVELPPEDDTTSGTVPGDTTADPDATTPADENTGNGRKVYTFSPTVRVLVIATGLVVGASLYAAIVVPHEVRRRHNRQS